MYVIAGYPPLTTATTVYFEIEEIYNFSQDDLLTEDSVILDTHPEIFIWVVNPLTPRKHSSNECLWMELERLSHKPSKNLLVGPQSFEEATSLMYANSLVDICLGICGVFPTFVDGPSHQTSQSKSIVDLDYLTVSNEIDEYELVYPFDILTPLEKTVFWNGVASAHFPFKATKDVIAELTKLASTKRIATADFSEVCRTLKKVLIITQMTILPFLLQLIIDSNLAVAVEAIQALGNFDTRNQIEREKAYYDYGTY
ncbi:hypothetical protein LXL04_014085 [Taraxacum kok-saghyz]